MGRLIFSAQEALDPQTPTKTKGEIRPRTELLHNPGQTGPISTYARQLRPLSCHINSQTWSRRVVACGDFDFKHQFASPRGFYSEIDFKHPKASKGRKGRWGLVSCHRRKKSFVSRLRTDKGHRWAGRHGRNVYGREMTIF